MAAPDALLIEMTLGDALLDTAGRPLLDTLGRPVLDVGSWVDVQEDVLSETAITIFQGQREDNPNNHVADEGTISLVMDNSGNNSAGLVGYYSPDHANRRSGFDVGTLLRVGMVKDSVTHWISQGRIVSIAPAAGLLATKTVDVTAHDWIEMASRTPIPRLAVQQGKSDDQIIQSIVDAMDDPPREVDLNVGAYEYDYALTDVEDQETKVLTVLQRLAQSGLGRIFITGGTTSGEILRYKDFYSLLTSETPVAVFANDMMNMTAARRAYNRVKRVVATVYPQAIDETDVVLFSLTQEIAIPAGGSIDFTGFYRDPRGSSSSSIAAASVVTPVVDTDYKFSSVSGAGTDLNGNLQLTSFEVGANAFYVQIKNTSSTPGYLWFFQARGKGLYPYDPLNYTALEATIKESEGTTLKYDIPYQSDYYACKEIADLMLGWYKDPVTEVPSLEFVPTLTEENFSKMLACKPGEPIVLSESVTGIVEDMIVLGFELQIWNGGAYITERLFIAPAQQATNGGLYFTLNTLGRDDLDGDNSLLAFG